MLGSSKLVRGKTAEIKKSGRFEGEDGEEVGKDETVECGPSLCILYAGQYMA